MVSNPRTPPSAGLAGGSAPKGAGPPVAFGAEDTLVVASATVSGQAHGDAVSARARST
jgi:hypothetical protein